MKQYKNMSIRAKWEAVKEVIYKRRSAFNYQEWQVITTFMKF
jgi:hypothetical protein